MNDKKINVLSLFDGMSCGQLALRKAGINVHKYFASEIKEHAIKVTQYNFPDTIQLGDVREIKKEHFGHFKIDLLIGGSPCQDFSRANANRDGLEGEKSMLFFEYMRLLKELKPKYFLLENVMMKPYDYWFICNELDCEPVRINSSLVSAQLRDRYYWTNIPPFSYDITGRIISNIPQPSDKRVYLKDVLTHGFTDRRKSRALLESDSRPLRNPRKMLHRYIDTGFTTVFFDNKEILKKVKGRKQNWNCDRDGFEFDVTKADIRYLNQTELERLQTVPEGYTSILSRDDAACLLGDGWTVDVIAHIFRELNID